jgi:5-methylthioadenosine/S-adenosylhomocysteine deaminase
LKALRIIIIGLSCLAAIFILAVFLFSDKKQNKIQADIVITNARVITLDAQSHIYSPGWVAIKSGKIIGLGSGKAPYIGEKQINAQGKVAMPGLINTHAHSAMALLTGLGQNEALEPWLNTMSPYEAKLSQDNVMWGTLLAEDKMITSGTTAFNDMYFFPAGTAQAVGQAGMRAVLRIPTSTNQGKVGFDESLVKENQNNPLVSFSLAPNPLLNFTPNELKQVSDYALAHNYLVHIHFEEDSQARADALKKYKLSPLELIAQSGMLRNKIVLAHGVDLTLAEINTLAQYPNAGVSFNPLSEFNLKTPLTPAPAMLNQNINVAFGTDGEPSSNLDMFAQMNFAAKGYLSCNAGQKFCRNGKTIDPEKIIHMATIDAAKILGLDKITGSLETGKQADIILVNVSSPDDIYSALVYNTNGSAVEDSIINGKLVMENRRLLSINQVQTEQKAAAISTSLKNPTQP